MSPSNAQDVRLRDLMSTWDAVAGTPLPNGHLSLIATTTDGKVGVAEVLDPQGRALPPAEATRVLGQVRTDATRLVDHVADAVTAAVALRVEAGEDVNLAEVARDANLGRQTLYRRLEDLGVAPTAEAPA